MGKKLPPKHLEFYKKVDEVLFYQWDPIGISNDDWGRDEYQSYLPQVYRLALENSAPTEIAKYLTEVSSVSMGLSPAEGHDLKIAKLILELKKSIGLP